MRRSVLGVALLAICSGVLANAESAASSADEQAVIQEIEVEIERARQQIDAAARQLANLHKQKHALDSGGNKAMLGVLLDGNDEQAGLEIVGVTPGGGADAAGMQAGDRIIAINGVSVEDDPQPRKALVSVMQDVAPGEAVAVVYRRGGESVQTTITTQARAVHMIALLDEKADMKHGAQALDLGDLRIELKALGADGSTDTADRPAINRQVWVQKTSARHALMPVTGEMARYFDVDEGVVVRDVAQDAELKPGDVLLKIAGTPIGNLGQAVELLDDLNGEAEVQVKRHGRKLDVTVRAGDFAGAGETLVKKIIRVGPADDEINVEIFDDE